MSAAPQETAIRAGPAVHIGCHERTGTRAVPLVFAACRQGKRG